MILFHTNLSDSSTLTASSYGANLPVTNVQDSRAQKAWLTGTSSATEYIVGDMGSAKAVTSVILHAHTLLATDSAIKFQMNSSDSWSSPAYSVDLTWSAKTISKTFAAQTYRYWRIVFTKSSAGVSRQIGRVYVGPYTSIATYPDNDPEWNIQDASEIDVSVGGDKYAEIHEIRNYAKVAFGSLNETESGYLRTFFNAVGKHTPFFVQIETIAPLDAVYYVRNQADLKQKQKNWGSTLKWSQSLEFIEEVA